MTILIIIAIVATVVIYVVYLTHGNYEEPKKQAQQPKVPKHFDLLDENGDPLPPTPRQEPEVKSLRYFCIKDSGYNVTVWPKDQRMGDYLEFTIAGLNHRDNSKYLGEFTGYLEAEPTNDYDPNAIKSLLLLYRQKQWPLLLRLLHHSQIIWPKSYPFIPTTPSSSSSMSFHLSRPPIWSKSSPNVSPRTSKNVNKLMKIPLKSWYQQNPTQSPPSPLSRRTGILCKMAERLWEWGEEKAEEMRRGNAISRIWSQNRRNVYPDVYPRLPRSP